MEGPLDPFFEESSVCHRVYYQKPRRVVAVNGLTLTLDDGTELIDGTGGPAVCALGYSNQEVADAVSEQVHNMPFIATGMNFHCDVTEQLASKLLKHRPGGLSKAIFLNSGSEANDSAVKLITQYWFNMGQPARRNFISRKQSYFGNTLGTLAISGQELKRKLYADWMPSNVSFVEPCYPYRGMHQGESDAAYLERLRLDLEAEFKRLGPDTVAAFVGETIGGSTLPCTTAVPGYWKMVRETCDKYGALLMLDEVMCGMGRTGTTHAWEQEGIRGPDIQSVGKTLGGGYVPLSAVLIHEDVWTGISKKGYRMVGGGHTFQAHPVACAGALAAQTVVQRDNLTERCREMGHLLEDLLREHIAPLPMVGDTRGRGLFQAVEFMLDKHNLTPFPLMDDFGQRVYGTAKTLGLSLMNPFAGTGVHKVDSVMITPPYIVSEEELRKIVSILKEAIIKVSEPYLPKEVPAELATRQEQAML